MRPEEIMKQINNLTFAEKLLLIEDDEDTLLLLKEFLEEYDYKVSAQTTVTDALSNLSIYSFDIIILDLGLPDFSGYEILKYAQINNLLVIGTGNLSEATVGYFTKWGDGAHDLNPLANLTKREVYILAKYLGVPKAIINAKPSADLWPGQTDEDELGLTYEQIDEFILNGTSGDNKIDEIIQTKKDRNTHKLEPIAKFED